MSSNLAGWESFGGLHRTFKKICATAFRFLRDDYGFTLRGIEEQSRVAALLYMNPTTGVYSTWEVWDERIDVYVVRLSLPDTWSARRDPDRWWTVEQLMQRAAPAWEPPRQHPDTEIDEQRMIAIISAYATALRGYGDAVLRGDFSIFSG